MSKLVFLRCIFLKKRMNYVQTDKLLGEKRQRPPIKWNEWDDVDDDAFLG